MFRSLALVLALSGTLAVADSVRAAETLTPLPNLPISGTTGEKPQSKLWFHDGHWWAVLASSVSPSGVWLWRLEDNLTWTNVLRIASGTGFKADTKSLGDVVHVLLQASAGQLVSLEYVPALGTYMPWSVRPGATPISLSGSETATLDIDTTGRIWVSTESGNNILVWYSDYPYTSFSGPLTLANNIKPDDISVVVALPLPLPSKVGVFWSNQNTKLFGFRTHKDGDPAGTWSADELPASQSAKNVGGGMADDHMNASVASDGTLYLAVKTSWNSKTLPLVSLLVRRPTGTWDDLYQVEQGAGTRGSVLLNEDLGFIRVFYTANSGGGTIYYRDSPFAPIAFGARKTALTGNLNNVTSTKDNWTDQLVILAAGHGVLFRESGVATTTSTTSTSSTSTSSTSTSRTSTTSTSSTTAITAPPTTATSSTSTSVSSPSSTSSSTSTAPTTTSSTTTTAVANAAGSVTADVSVVIGSATKYGTATKLEVDNSPVKHTYLQLAVSGTGGHAIASAILHLTVATTSGADSPTKGRLHVAACGWSETTLSGTTNPQPAITAAVLDAPAGNAVPGSGVDFDVKGAITGGDGTYCVAIDSVNSDGVDYVSREASAGRPTLAVTVVP